MYRSIQTLSIFFLLTLVSAVRAQTPETCAIEVDGPSAVDPGTPLVFKVKVTGKLPTATPEFKWYLSLGTISKGEGTDEITIDTAGLGGLTLTATAELTGAPSGCKNVASITTTITLLQPPSCPLDQYGDIKFDDEQARLDNFAIQILNSSPSRVDLSYCMLVRKRLKKKRRTDFNAPRRICQILEGSIQVESSPSIAVLLRS